MKRITAPTMGFKAFHSVAATIAEIEAAHMIRKGQVPANGATSFQVSRGSQHNHVRRSVPIILQGGLRQNPLACA